MGEIAEEWPPTSSKAALRSWVRAKRRALTDLPATGSVLGPEHEPDEGFADAVLGRPEVRAALDDHPQAPVLVYVEARGEPPTSGLRGRLRQAGRQVLVPWALPDREMKWLPDTGAAQPWGLPGVGQPQDSSSAIAAAELLARGPAVLILPALAATARGDRLGQGGGYYDTLLAECPRWSAGGPLRVALVWSWEVVEELPVDQHDQPVDLVVSYPPT